jgi:hypothetical protein
LSIASKNLAAYGKMTADAADSVARNLYAGYGEGARLALAYERDCALAAIEEARAIIALVDSLDRDACALQEARGDV